VSSAPNERPVRDGEGWAWSAKLVSFVGLFLSLGVALSWAAVLAGAPPAGALLTAWSVLPLVAAALGASWFLTSRVERRPFVSLGLRLERGGLGDLGLGVGIGLVLIGGVIAAFAALGWLSWESAPEPGSAVAAAAAIFGLLLGAAFAEELLFRGYPFQVLLRRFGPLVALAATSLAFGGLHAFNPNTSPLALANISIAGLLLGTAYLRTGSLWFATGVHLGWNWAMALSELSVSGLPEFGMPGIDAVVSGPDLWTGGAFGPEGGLAVTIASVLGIYWMWRLGPRDVNLSALDAVASAPQTVATRGFKLRAEGVLNEPKSDRQS